MEGCWDTDGDFQRRAKRKGRVQAEVISHVHERDVQHCEGGEETTRWAASADGTLSDKLPPSRERWRAGVIRPPRHTGQTDGRSLVTATVREGEDDDDGERGEGGGAYLERAFCAWCLWCL